MKLIKLLLVCVGIALSSQSFAGVEEDVLGKLKQNFPGIDFNGVSKTPVSGIYEVIVNKKEVIYSDEGGNYFFPTMIHMADGKNYGELKKAELNKIDFKSLPFKDAIKIVKGSGARKVAVFSDPDCPYCTRLESSLKSVDNVTIYLFEFPLAGLHPGATEKAISTWCSSNPAATWTAMMQEGAVPAKKTCPNPIDRNIDLAKKLGIFGTPALIFENGMVAPGALEATAIEQNLAKK